MAKWSDGIERPESYEGNALTRAISEYFAGPLEAEAARLSRENAEMRAMLDPQMSFDLAAPRAMAAAK